MNFEYALHDDAPSSPVHHASLVDPAQHSPLLLELIDVKITSGVFDYVVDCVVETVDFAMNRPTPSTSRGFRSSRRPELASFTTFVTNVITRAEVTTPTLLAALAYIDRAKPYLHISIEEWARERVFLGALIVAAKYLNDSTLKNVHWALCTGVFGKRDVGRIEREFLDVLNFELAIAESDLLAHYHGIMTVAEHFEQKSSPVYRGRSHHHTRRHSRNIAPALSHSPDSPSSSSSSTSPRTPSSVRSSGYSSQPSKHESPPVVTSSKGPFMEILRSFPIPIPSRHQRRSVDHSQYPISVVV
ncbi:hypothetical protein BDN72DRAFT_815631 [Pluteus cervinus]|uniref:Uncharacterized protein n=1 Tax=Pluteus cervinus TaxID=181527 RepID=A0ACD3B518_9AGAR|nr:hypothetical protein BDN72DRAFT_815631 [Pluteus cervinus]